MRVIYRSATKLRLHSSFYSWFIEATKNAAAFFVDKVGEGAIARFFLSAFAWIVFVGCLPIGIAILTIAWAHDVLLVRGVRWLEPEAERVTVHDSGSFNATSEEEVNSHLVTLVITAEGPPPEVDLLREKVAVLVNGVERSPKLRQTLNHRLGCRVWKKDRDFDIRNHVTSESGKWKGVILNEEAIRYWVDDFCNGGLPCYHPPWHVAVVPYFDHGRSENHAYVIRVHRELVPFFKLSDLVEDCQPANLELKKAVETALNPSQLSDTEEPIPFPPADYKSAIILIKRNCKIIGKVLRLAWIAPWLLYTELLCSCRYWMPRHYDKRGRTSRKVMFWSDEIQNSLLRKIKEESKVSTGTILMSCLSGALKQYYRLTGVRTPEDVLAFIPMYDQPTLDLDENCPRQYRTLALPMGLGDSISRLQTVKYRRSKDRGAIRQELSRTAMGYLRKLLPPVLMKVANDLISRKYLAVINNVYVCDSTGKIFGSKALNVFYWRPLTNHAGISLSLMNYDDKITLVVKAKREVIQRPDVLVFAFKRELLDLALAFNIPMERKTTPPPSPTIRNYPSDY